MGFNFLEEARRVIGIISVSEHGTADLAEHLAGLIEKTDLAVRLEEAPLRGVRQVNLVAEKGTEGREDLLLNVHLDTVPPGDPAAWTACGGDPYQAVVAGDRIYGLGSADTKLDFLCKLKALEEFRGIPFRHRVSLVGTYGEEVGLLGAQALVDAGYFNFAYGLIGEPSGLRPILAHKGLSVWEIRIDPTSGGPPPEERIEMMELVFGGTAAHASTPHLGVNAITGALEFIVRAEEQGRAPKLFSIDGGTASNVVPDRCRLLLGSNTLLAEDARKAGVRIEERGVSAGRPIGCVTIFRSILDRLRVLSERLGEKEDDLFKPPVTTMNVGRIASAEGVVRIAFEVRPIPGLPLEELSETIGALEDAISTLHPESMLQINNPRSNPPMRDAREGKILGMALDTITELGLPAEAATKATCTEAAVYSQMGIDTIVFGPGASEGNVHRPNEHNLLSECEKAVAFYTRMIERLCV